MDSLYLKTISKGKSFQATASVLNLSADLKNGFFVFGGPCFHSVDSLSPFAVFHAALVVVCALSAPAVLGRICGISCHLALLFVSADF